MTKSTLASKYRSLMVRKSHNKAIVALAHKMIRLMYLLLTRRQPYIDAHIDYAAISAQKNADEIPSGCEPILHRQIRQC